MQDAIYASVNLCTGSFLLTDLHTLILGTTVTSVPTALTALTS